MFTPHNASFRTVTIHGLVATMDGKPSVITLNRKPSFPQPYFQAVRKSGKYPPPDDISPLAIVGQLDLEVRVVLDSDLPSTPGKAPGVLGRGRAGHVYPLEVVSVRSACEPGEGGDIPESHLISAEDLPPLCIKIGTPTYARRLAREAWYYERFDKANMTGIIAPRCYGVFSANLAPKDSQRLWIALPDYDHEAQLDAAFRHRTSWTADLLEETVYNGPPDDDDVLPTVGPQYLDDPKGSHAASPWLNMLEKRDEPTLTVLILEKLGERLTYDDFDQDEEDLDQLFDHLFAMNIDHGDERFRNILRAPDTAAVPCSEHGKRHKWMMVDWENALSVVEYDGKEYTLNRGRWQLKLYWKYPTMVQD